MGIRFPILSFNIESKQVPSIRRVRFFVRATQTERTGKLKDSKVDIMEGKQSSSTRREMTCFAGAWTK